MKESLEAIEKSQGVDAVFSKIEDLLKTEQDAFAIQALFEYMMQHERQLYDFPLTSNLPPAMSGVSFPQGALAVASRLTYCEMLGGCGAYNVHTLDNCTFMGGCQSGGTLRDLYELTTPTSTDARSRHRIGALACVASVRSLSMWVIVFRQAQYCAY